MTKILCEVFRSRKTEGMYLYVNKSDGLNSIPKQLNELFGKAESVMTFVLHEDKQLAMANAKKVIEMIEKDGYYLQFPDSKDDYMQVINQQNTKLSG